jgi:hypothetical protein
MKNLTYLVLISPFVGFGLLALASTLGYSFPFALVAAHLLGFTCAAGALVMFLKDYAAPSRYSARTAHRTAHAGTVLHPVVRPMMPRAHPTPRVSMPVLGFTHNPATLTIS